AILSRPVEETYHLFIIVPHGGAPEKAIQVERALLVERNPSVHDFACFLDSLNLTTHLEGRNRYDLTRASWTHPLSERARHQSSHPPVPQVLTQRVGAEN
ncbi:MAG: hypothetical protein ABI856_19345, partial [Nitrospira sp.]